MGQSFTYKNIDNYRKMKVLIVAASINFPVHDLGAVKTVAYINKGYFKNGLEDFQIGSKGTAVFGSIPDNFIEAQLLQ